MEMETKNGRTNEYTKKINTHIIPSIDKRHRHGRQENNSFNVFVVRVCAMQCVSDFMAK